MTEKKDRLLEVLADDWAFVYLDSRRPGVVVPPWLKKNHSLALQIGHNMTKPIPDLQIDDEGFRCTLSFSLAPHWCSVPWDAVFCIRSDSHKDRVYHWPESMPEEMRPKISSAVRKDAPIPRRERSKQPANEASQPLPEKVQTFARPRLRVIKGGKT